MKVVVAVAALAGIKEGVFKDIFNKKSNEDKPE